MELLLIRHAYPDYVNDTLTEKGHQEAKLLAERLREIHLDKIYVSPLGRAQATMRPTAELKGIEPVTLDWLREVKPPEGCDPWNHPAEDVFNRERIPALETWTEEVSYAKAYEPIHTMVAKAFDELVASHGYVREGGLYRVAKHSAERIACFTHNGLIRTVLSHALNWAFPVMINYCQISPSGLTQLYWREKDGLSVPDMRLFNSISHLDTMRVRREDGSLPVTAYK